MTNPDTRLLSRAEIESLRQEMIDADASAAKAFAHLRPNAAAAAMLSPSEQESLRRDKKKADDAARRAFAHLRPEESETAATPPAANTPCRITTQLASKRCDVGVVALVGDPIVVPLHTGRGHDMVSSRAAQRPHQWSSRTGGKAAIVSGWPPGPGRIATVGGSARHSLPLPPGRTVACLQVSQRAGRRIGLAVARARFTLFLPRTGFQLKDAVLPGFDDTAAPMSQPVVSIR